MITFNLHATLKRIFYLLFITVVFAFTSSSLNASHIVGGEIGYRCLGNGQYEVNLSIYRDCFYGEADAPFDEEASVGIFNARTGQFIKELRIPFMQDDTLSGIFQDDCLIIPSDVCVHTSTYSAVVDLMTIDDGYELVYQRCCRNQTIANIVNPLETGATYSITLTRAAMVGCNSTPRFKEWPPIFVCVDEPIFYDHGAIDVDGDSLVYELFTPFTGATEAMPKPQPPAAPPYENLMWQESVYGLDNMLGAGRALRIDNRQGFLFARPGLQGQFVVGVAVKEYRNGELLSITRRDFQYNIGACKEIGAALTAPELQCDDLEVSFENISREADDFIWTFDFPNPNSPISTEASPTFTYPDTGIYTVELVVEPESVCSDTMYHVIDLRNNTVEADLAIESFNCNQDTAIITLTDASIDSISPISNWFWEINYSDTTINLEGERTSFFVTEEVSGTVDLLVQTEDGCTQTVQTTFETDMVEPGALIPDTVFICEGDSIELFPLVDPNTSSRFRWRPAVAIDNPNVPNPTAAPRDTTTYTVRIIDSNNFCEVEKEITVAVLPSPELENLTFEEDCQDALTLQFNATVQNTDSVQWNFGDGTSQLSIDAFAVAHTYPDTGTYEVQLVLFSGTCVDTVRQNIELQGESSQELSLLSAGEDVITCEATTRLQVDTLNILSYRWFTAQDTLLAINDDVIVPVEGVSTYVVKGTTTRGCEITDTIQVRGSQIVLAVEGGRAFCTGDPVSINAVNTAINGDTTNIQYEWTTIDGTIVGRANTATPDLELEFGEQTFQVTAQNEFGCTDTTEVALTLINRDFELDFIANIQCDFSSVSFINTSSDTTLRYKWLLGDANQSFSNEDSLLFNYDQPGLYNACLTIDYEASCVDTLCQTLEIEGSLLSAEFVVDEIVCTEDSTVISFAAVSNLIGAGATFSWNFSDSTSSTERIPSRTIYDDEMLIVELTVMASEACVLTKKDTFEFEVLEIELDSFFSICRGNEVRLNPNGNPNYNYRWTPSSTLDSSLIASPIARPNRTTDYVLAVQDPNIPECRFQKEFTIEVTDDLNLGFPDVLNICEQETELSLPQFDDANVVWISDTGDSTRSNTLLIPATYEGSYIVEAMDSVGCFGLDTIQVENSNAIEITRPIGDTVLTCEGQSVLIVLENQIPEQDIQISYFPNDNIIMGDSTLRPTFFGFQDTILNLYYEVTNQFGCVLNDSMAIKIRDFDITLPDEINVCQNIPTELHPNFNSGYTYTWSPATGLSDPNIGNPVATLMQGQLYTVDIALGQNAGACRATREVAVDISQAGRLQISRDTFVCQSTEVTLMASSDSVATYEWAADPRFEDILGFDSTLTVLSDTGAVDYYVRAISPNGCIASSFVRVNTFPIDIELPDTTFGCAGEPLLLNAINNGFDQQLNYEWIPEDIIIDGIGSASPEVEGEDGLLVTAIASNAFNCVDTAQTYLSIVDVTDESVRATASPDTVFLNRSSQLDVIGLDDSFTYTWSPNFSLDADDISDPTATPFETTTYTVEISKDGCTFRRFVEVFVTQGDCNEPFIFVPAGFTPNGDGRNDMLFVRGNIIEQLYFAVYNRWGQRVFETTNQSVGWDGTFKGRALPPDVYAFYLEVQCTNGQSFFKEGDVTILK